MAAPECRNLCQVGNEAARLALDAWDSTYPHSTVPILGIECEHTALSGLELLRYEPREQ